MVAHAYQVWGVCVYSRWVQGTKLIKAWRLDFQASFLSFRSLVTAFSNTITFTQPTQFQWRRNPLFALNASLPSTTSIAPHGLGIDVNQPIAYLGSQQPIQPHTAMNVCSLSEAACVVISRRFKPVNVSNNYVKGVVGSSCLSRWCLDTALLGLIKGEYLHLRRHQ